MSFELYDHQKSVKLAIYRAWRNPLVKRILTFAPTGFGKTILAASIIEDAVKKGKRVWFLVHRNALIKQTQETLASIGIDSGVICSDMPMNLNAPVQIASLPTLDNRDISQYGHCDLLVVDEAHNSTYLKAFTECLNYHTQDAGGIWDLSNLRVLGLSATPYRSNTKEGYCRYFQRVIRALDEWDLVNMGELKHPRVFSFNAVNYESLDNDHDEYSDADMKLVCNEELNIITVQKFLETCPDRKTVFFCGRVDQATHLVTLLRVAGIKAKLVVGNTSMQERDVIFTELKNGDIQAIASVGALTEGFDEKSVNCVVLNRPIKSKALLKQAIGRGLRKFLGLPDCIILDMGDSIKRVLQGDPLAKITIDLCPKHRRIPVFAKDFQVNEFKFPLKQCPKCGHEHIAILRVCPDCGHIYESHELPTLKLGDNWGESPDPLTLSRINYIRTQLRTAFTRETNPNKVRFNFYQKFKKFPADSWFFGALFGGKNPGTNLIRYREHLAKVLKTPLFTPKERDIEIWVKREFHKDQSHSLYLPPDKSSDPFIILGVGTSIIETGKISELEQSYRSKASQIEQEYHAGLYSRELYLTYCQCIDTAYQTIRANFEVQDNQNQFMI